MVYSPDGILGAEAVAAQKTLAVLLSYKLKRELSEMCGFVQARMSLAMVRSNRLLLTDGALMPLLALWSG